jgi:hypothetical protein
MSRERINLNLPHKETYKLKDDELIALIQGKSLNFMVPGKFHVEVLPPTYGIKIDYDDWIKIATFLRCAAYPDSSAMDELINKIEDRK